MCVCVCVCVCINMCVCRFVCVCMCEYTNIMYSIYLYVCIYWISFSLYIYMYIYIYMYTFITYSRFLCQLWHFTGSCSLSTTLCKTLVIAHSTLTLVALLKHCMLKGTFVPNSTACHFYLCDYFRRAWKYPSTFKPFWTDLWGAYYLPTYLWVWIQILYTVFS